MNWLKKWQKKTLENVSKFVGLLKWTRRTKVNTSKKGPGILDKIGKKIDEHAGLMIWTLLFAITFLFSLFLGWKIWAILALFFVFVYISALLMLELGKRNLFWTLIEEGQAKGVTIFGRAHKCLLAFTTHRFKGDSDPNAHFHSDTWWDIEHLDQSKLRPEKGLWHAFSKHILGLEIGGLKWIGIWPIYQIYTYVFRWTSLRGHMPTDKPTGEDYVYEEARSRLLDYILVRQETYLLDLKGIEDSEQLSIDIKLIWTNKVINPFKALFRVRNWLETSADRLLTHIRREFAKVTWKSFQQGDNLADTLRGILDEIENEYGVKTVGLEITDLKPPAEFLSAAQSIREAQASVQVALHKAEAATHEATAIKTIADAEAERVGKVMGAAIQLGDEGVAMKVAEDLAKGQGQVNFFGTTVMELVKSILGKKEGQK
jgi:hypothetical protein